MNESAAMSLAAHANQEINKIYEILKSICQRISLIEASLRPNPQTNSQWVLLNQNEKKEVGIGEMVAAVLLSISNLQNCPHCLEAERQKSELH